jgi:phosphoribosylanthranilate isomerase
MVFYEKADRRVSIEIAGQIVAALPPFVTPVALFVDSPIEEILDVARALKLRTVQLHGVESPELLEQLDGLSVIKAVRASRANLQATLDQWRRASRSLPPGRMAAILIETATAETGGTGIENDWAFLQTAMQNGWLADLPPIVLAGGLTPENVGNVVRTLRPYAVDVSSGIEQVRGIKSVAKMQAFTAAVEQAG